MYELMDKFKLFVYKIRLDKTIKKLDYYQHKYTNSTNDADKMKYHKKACKYEDKMYIDDEIYENYRTKLLTRDD